MNNAEAVAYIQAQCVCAQAEIESMKAHDRSSDERYTEDAYLQVPIKYGLHHNAVLGLFQESQ